MADVTQKIKTGNTQPQEGRIVLQTQWTNPTGYQTINPPVNKGLTVAQFETALTSDLSLSQPFTETADTKYIESAWIVKVLELPVKISS